MRAACALRPIRRAPCPAPPPLPTAVRPRGACRRWHAPATLLLGGPRRVGAARAERLAALRAGGCCFSTAGGGGGDDDAKLESRLLAYRLMARSHARWDDGHKPQPDAMDVLVEQVTAEGLVRAPTASLRTAHRPRYRR